MLATVVVCWDTTLDTTVLQQLSVRRILFLRNVFCAYKDWEGRPTQGTRLVGFGALRVLSTPVFQSTDFGGFPQKVVIQRRRRGPGFHIPPPLSLQRKDSSRCFGSWVHTEVRSRIL